MKITATRFLLWLSLLVVFCSSTQIFDRVFIVVFENQDVEQVRANAYFSALEKRGMLCTDYHAMVHPSQPNYISFIGGSVRGVVNNDNYNLAGDSLVDLLEAKGITWGAYMEGFPGSCFDGAIAGRYARKHNPFISFDNIRTNSSRCSRIVGAPQLDIDIAANELPAYSFYTPDLDNDGHDTNISYSATWLEKFLEPKLANKNFTEGTLVVITYDESSRNGDNVIYTLLLGDLVCPNTQYATTITHVGLLATIENNWDLGNLGFDDASALPFNISVFKPYTAVCPPISQPTSPSSSQSSSRHALPTTCVLLASLLVVLLNTL